VGKRGGWKKEDVKREKNTKTEEGGKRGYLLPQKKGQKVALEKRSSQLMYLQRDHEQR